MTAGTARPLQPSDSGPLATEEDRPIHLWAALRRRPLALGAAGYLTLLLAAAIAARWLAPYDPAKQDLAHTLSGPTATHWLGTDRLGRDVLSRLIVGARPTVFSAAEAVIVFLVVGMSLGLAAGYVGRWADRTISWISELVLALPGILVLLMVLAVFPNNDAAAMVAYGLLSAPLLLRVVRGLTLETRQELYVKAARLSGLSGPKVMRRHILPRLAGPIIVQVSLFAASAVLAQAGLSFLGLAAPESQGPSWGNMVAEAQDVISDDGWLLVPTGGILAITVLALGLLGDALRDATFERTRGGQATVRRRRSAPPAGAGEHPADTGTLLSIRGLTISFQTATGWRTVVRDVGFDLAAGEAIGIVGESGCGKTLTARALCGLLPAGGRISAGSAHFAGRDLSAWTQSELNRVRGADIGLVSQEPISGLDPCFRIGSQLVEVIRRHEPMSRRDARARAIELLGMVRLDEPTALLRQYPHEMSGGMAQRISIALALAGRPRLLIADEPTTALDVTVQAEILELLRELQRRLGMAIILITHDWGVLAGLCTRAIVMYAGEVVEEAGLTDLYRRPRHPYTEALLAADPSLAPVGSELPAIPGSVPSPAAWPPGCHFHPRCAYANGDCESGRIPVAAPAPGRLTRCLHFDKLAP